MLIKVKRVAHEDTPYTYAPPQRDALLNTEDIVSAVNASNERGSGPFLRVNLRDGTHMIIVGTVEELLRRSQPDSPGEK